MEHVRIRTVKKEDFLEIMDLASKCDPIPVERDSIYHLFTKYFANTCFVAEKENKIVGYILGFISQLEKNVAYIHNICISPDLRDIKNNKKFDWGYKYSKSIYTIFYIYYQKALIKARREWEYEGK